MRNPWRLVKQNLIYQNKFGYKLFDDDVITPNGKSGKYMVLELAGAVTVVALTSDKQVLFINQWRYPAGKEFLELPAGSITDPDEDPFARAQKELQEETGAISDHWTKLTEYWLGNGAMKIKSHVFLAEDIILGQDSPEDTEKITQKLINLPDAVKMVEDGLVDEERTIIGILLADKYLKRD